MSYTAQNLSVLAYAKGFTLWHYKSEGSIAEIADPHYFEEAGDLLAAGDMLLASGDDGGRLLFATPTWGRMRTVPMG
jgi:hypothetical protein